MEDAMEIIMGDRRMDRRYDVELELRYKLVRGHRVIQRGLGKTLSMSRNGLSFTTDRPLPTGCAVELSIEWPICLYGRYPLQLHMMGHVIRSDRGVAAVKTTWHEFLRLDTVADHRPEMREVEAEAALVM
jgi:hypothetical protein